MNELVTKYGQPGLTTLYGMLEQGDKIVNSGGVLVSAATNWASGAIPLADTGGTTRYLGSIPVTTPLVGLTFNTYLQLGGSPAITDPLIAFDTYPVFWNGTERIYDPPGVIILLQGLEFPLSVIGSETIIASSMGGTTRSLVMFQNSKGIFNWKVENSLGGQYDLTGSQVTMVIHDPNSDSIEQKINAVLSASDPVNNPTILDTITVTVLAANVPAAGKFQYEVRDYTTDLVYGDGPLMVKWAPK